MQAASAYRGSEITQPRETRTRGWVWQPNPGEHWVWQPGAGEPAQPPAGSLQHYLEVFERHRKAMQMKEPELVWWQILLKSLRFLFFEPNPYWLVLFCFLLCLC